jgi:glycosyltransferase involved in cell wall biosynthesis
MRKVNRWIGAHRGEIDLVHCHHAKLNAWVGLRAARRIGVPCLVKIGSAGPNFDFLSLERKRFVYGRLAAREIRDGADGFVATSNEMMRDLLDYGIEGRRLAHIPNGVDMPGPVDGRTVARIRAEARLRDGERLVVFAGRMERQKNVETLLKAVAGIAARDLQARVLLLGDGALLDEHRRLAHSIGLDDRVRFAGRVEAIGDYLSAADLFVLPARAEGMSNAVLEAMAHGVPQVVSKVSGNTDLVIAGRTGWHYAPPEDAGALAGVLAEALATPPDRLAAMGEVSRRRVQEAFSIDTVAARHAALYRTLTEREDAYAHVA